MDSIQDENQEPSPRPEEAAGAPEVEPQQVEAGQAQIPEEPPQPARRPRAEEALAAMRADLREQESEEQAGRRGIKGLFQRLFRRGRKAPSPEFAEEQSRVDELKFPEPPSDRLAPPPAEPAAAETAVQEAPPATAPAEEAPPDFQSMVRNRLGDVFAENVQREPLEMQPPPLIEEDEGYPEGPTHSILTTLRQEEEPAPMPEPVDFRQAALEDYVVATDEPEEEQGPAMTRRIKRSWRYMRPGDRRLIVSALVFLGLLLLGGTGYAVVKGAPTPTVAPTPTFDAVPIPNSLSLPGGWIFPLSIGDVGPGGTWNPSRPEWLRTTVVCRWVSLPWTEQLEAVAQTFKANDEIQLSMSNYDNIVYQVQSRERVAAKDVGRLCPEGPGLLLILTKDGTDERLVITGKAKP
jgi:hypothetical protein